MPGASTACQVRGALEDLLVIDHEMIILFGKLLNSPIFWTMGRCLEVTGIRPDGLKQDVPERTVGASLGMPTVVDSLAAS